MKKYAVALLVLGSVCSGGGGGRAHADCVSTEPKLLWSLPADGATGVPLNVSFWAVTSFSGRQLRARLNGEAIDTPRIADGGDPRMMQVTPPRLEPNHSYKLELVYAPAGFYDEVDFTVSFTTGAENARAAVLPPPKVVGRRLFNGLDTSGIHCSELLTFQGCFDTTDRTASISLFELAQQSPSAVAWVVGTGEPDELQLWPASCGGAALLSVHIVDGCFKLQSLSESGQLSQITRYCVDKATKTPRRSPLLATGSAARHLGQRAPSRVVQGDEPRVSPAPGAPVEAVPAADPPRASWFSGCSASPSGSNRRASGLLVLLLALALTRRHRGGIARAGSRPPHGS
jgi:hypothetical protein